jgi:transposase
LGKIEQFYRWGHLLWSHCGLVYKQNLENLRRNRYALNVMCEANILTFPRSTAMRPLKSHFPDPALTTLDTLLKQTKEARVFRRAQAVREVVAGHHINAVSEAFHLANSALRKWVQRFAQEGPQGLRDRPRSGRPPKVTCELEQHLNRLVDQDPLQHGALASQWSCRELAMVLAQQTGVHLSRESVRGVLKKRGKLLPPHRSS